MEERTNEQKLADALMGVMLTEAAPEAYSQKEGDQAWSNGLEALKGNIPDSAYDLVEQTAKAYREDPDF